MRVSYDVKAVFLRQQKDKIGEEPKWVEEGSLYMDTSELPNVGDYIIVPLTDSRTVGTTVVSVSRRYERVHNSRLSREVLVLANVEIRIV
jgi:hypothetical protein